MYQNYNYLLKIYVIYLACYVSPSNAELSGLLSALQYFGLYGGSGSLGQSRGQCQYSFESFALLGDRHTCAPDDEHILHLTQLPPQRMPRIMIKCLQPEPAADNGNGTVTVPKLLIMKSAKDIVNLLKPIGNATTRHEHGSCVVVHFCTATSLECSRVAPSINLLPHLFPTLPVAYIDAYKFTPFNAEFGIVSLPTLMIFHQGQQMFMHTSYTDSEMRAFGTFIMRHTNVKSVDPNSIDPQILLQTLTEPLANTPEVQTDYYLGMAWAFILLCLANYVRGTIFWKQLVAMVQRNWRESEETQMDVVD